MLKEMEKELEEVTPVRLESLKRNKRKRDLEMEALHILKILPEPRRILQMWLHGGADGQKHPQNP